MMAALGVLLSPDLLAQLAQLALGSAATIAATLTKTVRLSGAVLGRHRSTEESFEIQ